MVQVVKILPDENQRQFLSNPIHNLAADDL